MPRRELLTFTERLELLAFPTDEAELIRLYTLIRQDVAFVRQHRGDHNRLGIAVQMAYLRFPGRVIGEREAPYEPVLNLLAAQLEIPVAAWDLYAKRDETRRGHLLEPVARTGMQQFNIGHYRSLVEWLETIALQTTRGMALAQALVEELRRRLIALPSLAVIERIAAEAGTRAQRKLFSLLTKDLSVEQRVWLDALLEQREGSPYSLLSWLRMPPGAPTARAVLSHIYVFKRTIYASSLDPLRRQAGDFACLARWPWGPRKLVVREWCGGILVKSLRRTGVTRSGVFLVDAEDRFTPSVRQRIDLDDLYAKALRLVRQVTDTNGEAQPLPKACHFALGCVIK